LTNQWTSTSPKITPEAPVPTLAPPSIPGRAEPTEVVEVTKAKVTGESRIQTAARAASIPLQDQKSGPPYTCTLDNSTWETWFRYVTHMNRAHIIKARKEPKVEIIQETGIESKAEVPKPSETIQAPLEAKSEPIVQPPTAEAPTVEIEVDSNILRFVKTAAMCRKNFDEFKILFEKMYRKADLFTAIEGAHCQIIDGKLVFLGG